MKVNLEVQTNNRFKAVCGNCASESVKFDISQGSMPDGWGGRMSYTKLSFKCGYCGSEWSEKY
ncbi:hypothetical protein FDG96_gp45 [Bacillus phage Mgbh1]|uniref:Uncharacterized protein n=1 Tax=Bacillus phage Mgbh1 TaxID=1796993 RepID=A0A142F1P7_9CAUD|nr:hypothetical protein FDG96_gp45 [Bacillus phage Mgbh1]AMQ66704.1 hypothetical protein [Bacillus phage Mgbh1]